MLSWAAPATATTATNLAGGVAGAVPYQSATGASGFSAAGTSGQVLVSGGTGAPTWINNIAGSAANVTGLVAVANGGTGISSYTAGDILYANATPTLAKLAKGTDGQVLTLASGLPVWAAAGGGGGVTSDANLNTVGGTGAMPKTTNESNNTAYGYQALNGVSVDWSSSNTAIGYQALLVAGNAADGSPATHNVAVGDSAGATVTSGSYNTLVGELAGGTILKIGSHNVMVGYKADTTSGNNGTSYSVAIGDSAKTAGTYNTAIGTSASAGGSSISNATAIGNGATVAANNTVRIGNASVTVIEGAVGWTNPSDLRLKQNIADSSLGLAFIQKLRPVTYSFTAQPTVTHEGLIAQEVEAAAQSVGTTFHALHAPTTPEGFYSLTYTNLVMPLINATKELKAENDQLRSELDTLKAELAEIKALLKK